MEVKLREAGETWQVGEHPINFVGGSELLSILPDFKRTQYAQSDAHTLKEDE